MFSVLIGVSSLVAAAILSAKEQAERCGKKVARLLAVCAVLMILIAAGYYILVSRGVSLNAFIVMLCAGSIAMGPLITNINIPINTAIMKTVDKDKLSKVSSIISIASQGLIPISSVLAGMILQYIGSTALLVFCGVGYLIAALLLLFNKAKDDI